jgi:gamma-glutamylcysteine synthetase
LLRNDLSYAVDPNWTALARFNLAKADNDSSSIRAAEFTDALVGLAFRPVNDERLNALVRFNYFEDLGPAGQITGSGQTQSPKQISKVASIDLNFDVSKKTDAWRQIRLSYR